MAIKTTLILLIPFKCWASTLFLPDSDTAALIALVSNTASTVTNTLKILETAKETSQKIDDYNHLAMRRVFIARRIEQHARDIAETKKMKPKGLREINSALLHLKNNIRNLKDNIHSMAESVWETDNFTDTHADRIANAIGDEREMHRQEVSSAGEGAVKKHIQNTAMNTALTGKILSKMRRDNIQYQKIDLGIKRNASVKALRREQFYQNWVGR